MFFVVIFQVKLVVVVTSIYLGREDIYGLHDNDVLNSPRLVPVGEMDFTLSFELSSSCVF